MFAQSVVTSTFLPEFSARVCVKNFVEKLPTGCHENEFL